MENSIQTQVENENADFSILQDVIEKLDQGILRVAEKNNDEWHINIWLKKAILQYMGKLPIKETQIGEIKFRDKLPLKKSFENVRIAPGGNSIRYGSYLAKSVIMMPPSYINIGAYIDKESMIDSNVLVGSCAQIGKKVHLSAGVQIGGVLEPTQSQPTIIEDQVFVGAGSIIVEGILIKKNAIIGAGVVISASTPIIEIDNNGKEIKRYKKEVPEGAIVIPGTRQKGSSAISIQTPIIIGYKNKENTKKVELNDFLKKF